MVDDDVDVLCVEGIVDCDDDAALVLEDNVRCEFLQDRNNINQLIKDQTMKFKYF